MGYTHYYTVHNNKLSDKGHEEVKAILEHGIKNKVLANWDGEKVATDISDLFIIHDDGTFTLLFNGITDKNEDCETFGITPDLKRDFCKTNYEPYDKYAVACLMVLETEGVLEWESDGNIADFLEALELIGELFPQSCIKLGM